MNEDAVRDYLDHYLDPATDAPFAVLLEGAWGTGKSFFVQQYFDQRLAAAKAKQKAKDPEPQPEIRVTLFGVTSFDDIMGQIFAKAHPWLAGKSARLVNFALSRGASIFGASLDEGGNNKLMQDMVLNLDGRILVFDDLERCPLPVVEVMGFINRFVEQEKLKVVVIASEADIPDREEYLGRKEKLIGKTIRIGSDPEPVLDHFIGELRSSQVADAVKAARADILSTFAASGLGNFRSLRAILNDFERLVIAAGPVLSDKPPALRALLLYMVATGMEIRANHIEPAGLPRVSRDIYYAPPGTGAAPDPERVSARAIRDRYPHVRWRDPIVEPEQIAELFASGTIDVTRLQAHIQAHPLVMGTEHVPEWRVMWNWYDLCAADFEAVRAIFVDQLAKRALVHPGEILHAAGTAIRLKTYGDDILGGKTASAFFKAYLADLGEKLVPAPHLFDAGAAGHGGLAYNERGTPAFNPVFAMVKAAAAAARARQMASEAPALLTRLRADPAQRRTLYESDADAPDLRSTAILHHIPVDDFAYLVLRDGTADDELLAALAKRYEYINHYPDLRPEKAWVRKLYAELGRRVRDLPPPHRKFSEMRLRQWRNQITGWTSPPKTKTAKAAPVSDAGDAGIEASA